MRTAKEQSPAKDKLIHSAVKLMRAKGYEATSVDDICCESKLTKGSFFHYFKDKESLAKAALEQFCGCFSESLGKGKKDPDPLKTLDGLIDRVIEISKEPDAIHGCLLGNFSQELADTHPEIRKMCADKFDGMTGAVRGLLDAIKAKYKPKEKVDTASLADYFLSVIQGGNILAKARQDLKVYVRNMEHLRSYIHTVFES